MRWIEKLLDRKTALNAHKFEAQGWDTCAIGEVVQDFPAIVAVIPYESPRLRKPKDAHLHRLGIRFAVAVSRNDRKKALEIYDAIQTRVRNLIKKAHAA